MRTVWITAIVLGCTLWLQAQEMLPSWNDGKAKERIIRYVKETTTAGSPNFIPKADRIAVFDNDGTLWSEQPVYFQLFFALDRVKALASEHPEWKTTEPFKSVLADDMKGVMKSGEKGLMEIVNATHSGMDVETFKTQVEAWVKRAKHPTKKRSYTELIYQPMMELIRYLEANDFKVYIVSGGGIDFMRTFVPETYGIPQEHIVGSNGKVHYENGKIIKDGEINFIDDKEAKPVAIYYNIGKRPVAAFGNSDGDLAMMQYTEANSRHKTLQLYVHHTDAKREWAYDRGSPVGALDKGLDYAKAHHWNIVDMKNDWKVVYPFELKQ